MKQYFNIVTSAKDNGFFISHPTNGAKGTVEKKVSKNNNGILVVKFSLGGSEYQGIFNKTAPEKLRENPKRAGIFGTLKNERGSEFKAAGWWTTTNKNGEKLKANYFSCSLEPLAQNHEEHAQVPENVEDYSDVPF